MAGKYFIINVKSRSGKALNIKMTFYYTALLERLYEKGCTKKLVDKQGGFMPEDTREKDADYAAEKRMPLHGSQNVDAVYQDTAAEDDIVELMMQYDEQAKKILGYKTILAFILSKAVAEFKGMLLSDIAELIEGEVLINKVPVDAGHTNMTKGERITGFNTENAETNEGLIFSAICISYLSPVPN